MNLSRPRDAYTTPLTQKDVAYLDATLLDIEGRLNLLPHSFYASLPPLHIAVWGNLNGRYGFPTLELVEWVKERINGRKAIEIGAGCGDFGHHLGIPMTDSYQQVRDPLTVQYYAQIGAVPTRPHKAVREEDAENAVRKAKADVVVASWVTQRHRPGDAVGNMFGPREEYILDRCKEYIFVGNESVHGTKRILSRPHEEYTFPWIVSRSVKPEQNVLWVWSKQ